MTELKQSFAADQQAKQWSERFLQDLAVVRTVSTVRAYRLDLERWLAFCALAVILPLAARPRPRH